MAKVKFFIIDLVLYPFDVAVSIGQSDEEFLKSLKKIIPPNCENDLKSDPEILSLPLSIKGRTINFSTGHQTVIRLKKFPATNYDYGHLAHEIFHAASFVLWRMGINLEIEKTDEVYAYLIDYLTKEIYNRLA